MSSNSKQPQDEKETNGKDNINAQTCSIINDQSIQLSNIKQEENRVILQSPMERIPNENSVKHKESSFSFKAPLQNHPYLASDFKLSPISNPQSCPNSNNPQDQPQHYEPTLFEEHSIKKPEPVQIGNINMNVNNYYSYFVDPTSETIKKRILEAKEKKKYICSCKKSQCLKLYCDCFANEEFCVDCNCQGCSNIIGNETRITKAFNEVKDKNPIAMKFNINEDTVALGCNCTKSNCLKKYCECFKAKLSCTELCRCRDCDNCTHAVDQPNVTHKQPMRKSYEKYSFEKISVMIDKQQIHINKQEHISRDKFLAKRQREQVLVRIKNHQTFIEIPKSLINITDEDYDVILNPDKIKNN